VGQAVAIGLLIVGIAVLLLNSSGSVSTGDGAPGDAGAAIPVNVAPLNLQVAQLAQAIANAEGFGIAGAVPTRAHNPGDLVLGDKGLGVANSAGVTIFASDAAGWSALYYELNLIFSGRSSVYQTSMSFAQFAQTWTGGDNAGAWAATVTSSVSASPDTALADWFNA
jgi:hypothetical protein